MKKAIYNALITEENGGYVALNLEYDVASQGNTVDQALANLQEALELYLEEFQENKKTKVNHPFVTTFSL